MIHEADLFSHKYGKSSYQDEIYLAAENEGVSVEHATLMLEGKDSRLINFISSVSQIENGIPLIGRQILVSDLMYQLLSDNHKKHSFLVCQYFRQISLGSLTIELLPSGESLGSSFVWLSKRNDSLLFASCWSKRSSPAVQKAIYKHAKVLLLRLNSDPMQLLSTNIRREEERFFDFSQKLVRAGESVVAIVDVYNHVHMLASRLHEDRIPIYCDSQVWQLVKTIYNNTPNNYLPNWVKAARKYTPGKPQAPGVIFLSKHQLLSKRMRTQPGGVWVWVGFDIEQIVRGNTPWISRSAIADIFLIQNSPDMAEIKEMIKEVKPEQVLVYGEYAEKCAKHLIQSGIKAEVFSPPKQYTLF